MQLDSLRVLIISPHFPPVNTADMQRVRMLLPFFRENGWQAEVLAVLPEQVAAPTDDWLLGGLPDDVPIHRVDALGLAWSRIPGLGSLGFRALHAIKKAGDHLLRHKKFDLIYFSTTVFDAHLLGPGWKKEFSVPFVMDYQDPWVNEYYREHPEIPPPGGHIKYKIIDVLHRWSEPRVLKHCSGITSVSESYPKQLKTRYPWLEKLPVLVQAFCGAESDFHRLGNADNGNTHFAKSDGSIHWVYVGVMVPMMEFSLRCFFRALQCSSDEQLKKNLKIHFIGTSYAPAGQGKPTVAAIAAEYGLEGMVDEQCNRVPYSQALNYLKNADALLAFGTDDLGYTASKIYPYLLARRPLLAIFNQNSSVVELLDNVGGGVSVPFINEEAIDSVAKRIDQHWLKQQQYAITKPLEEKAFLPYSDFGCAKELSAFFLSVLDNSRKQ